MSRKKTKEQFISESKKVHGDKYDYSKVVYIDANTKVPIIYCYWENVEENDEVIAWCKLSDIEPYKE